MSERTRDVGIQHCEISREKYNIISSFFFFFRFKLTILHYGGQTRRVGRLSTNYGTLAWQENRIFIFFFHDIFFIRTVDIHCN